jgi:hypothetical protein
MKSPYQFRVDEWLPRFPLDETSRYLHSPGITSPGHICLAEQLRSIIGDRVEWGPPAPVDIFIMAKGEPVHRFVTKVGGLPYRPRALPWPRNNYNEPMTFLAQFCFIDSRDIVGALPGDVLLVFAPTVDPPDFFHFEWYPMELDDLVGAEGVPSQPWSFPPCFGYTYRTKCYPEGEIGDDGDVMVGDTEVRSTWLLHRFQATQIGRHPMLIQFEDDEREIKGRVLCALNSVEPSLFDPHPWINHAEPLYTDRSRVPKDYDYLSFGDAGCVYISMDDAGKVYGHESCY